MSKDNGRKIQLPTTSELVERWMPVLELKGEWEDRCGNAPKLEERKYAFTATMLEHLAQTQLGEAVQANGGTRTGDVAKYDPVLIPMIRRIMPSLIGPEIFGTQPLQAPTGLIFALRASYANDADNYLKRSNSIIIVVDDATGISVGDTLTGSDSGATGTVRYMEGNKLLVEVTSGEFTAADTFNTGANSVADLLENEALFKSIFRNYTGRYATATGEVLGTSTREVAFDIDQVTVQAETRKLKARWTQELEEDLAAVHGMDAESLMSSIASDEITLEMNREFIDLIDDKATANSVVTWDYTAADGRWELEKYHNLLATINRQRREVAVDTRRGQANWIIVTPGVLSALEATGKMDSTGTDPMVDSFAGTLNGSIRVYVDIWEETEQILVGYKGREEVDAGMYYAPYIPLKINKGYGEEDNIPRLFFSTRYGIAENPLSKQYYRKILVTNLPV